LTTPPPPLASKKLILLREKKPRGQAAALHSSFPSSMAQALLESPRCVSSLAICEILSTIDMREMPALFKFGDTCMNAFRSLARVDPAPNFVIGLKSAGKDFYYNHRAATTWAELAALFRTESSSASGSPEEFVKVREHFDDIVKSAILSTTLNDACKAEIQNFDATRADIAIWNVQYAVIDSVHENVDGGTIIKSILPLLRGPTDSAAFATQMSGAIVA
jgi:hypothetical protein